MERLKTCDIECPVARAAHFIEAKWMTLIFKELLSGKKRYSELQRALVGISPKILSHRLKFLVEEGLVDKSIYATVPPTTEYELTAVGKEFRYVLLAMKNFGDQLLKKNKLENGV